MLTVVLRGGPQYRQPGDPFTWCCYIARHDIAGGYALAMIGSPTLAELRAARAELRALGFRRIDFTRVSGRWGSIRVG